MRSLPSLKSEGMTEYLSCGDFDSGGYRISLYADRFAMDHNHLWFKLASSSLKSPPIPRDG